MNTGTKNYGWVYHELIPNDSEEIWTDLDLATLTQNIEKMNAHLDSLDSTCQTITILAQQAQVTANTALGGATALFQQAILTGALDGTNAVYTVSPLPVNGIMVFKNGLLQHNGSTD